MLHALSKHASRLETVEVTVYISDSITAISPPLASRLRSLSLVHSDPSRPWVHAYFRGVLAQCVALETVHCAPGRGRENDNRCVLTELNIPPLDTVRRFRYFDYIEIDVPCARAILKQFPALEVCVYNECACVLCVCVCASMCVCVCV